MIDTGLRWFAATPQRGTMSVAYLLAWGAYGMVLSDRTGEVRRK